MTTTEKTPIELYKSIYDYIHEVYQEYLDKKTEYAALNENLIEAEKIIALPFDPTVPKEFKRYQEAKEKKDVYLDLMILKSDEINTARHAYQKVIEDHMIHHAGKSPLPMWKHMEIENRLEGDQELEDLRLLYIKTMHEAVVIRNKTAALYRAKKAKHYEEFAEYETGKPIPFIKDYAYQDEKFQGEPSDLFSYNAFKPDIKYFETGEALERILNRQTPFINPFQDDPIIPFKFKTYKYTNINDTAKGENN